jgi:anaphase-promoting complex subunit 4
LLTHCVLLAASEERRQFTVFSKWLRFQIDTQATSADTGDESQDRDPGIDFAQVLAYIEGGLSKSKITHFIRKQTDMAPLATEQRPEQLTFDEVCQIVERYRKGSLSVVGGLDIWSSFLQLQSICLNIFACIARWQASNTVLSSGLVLEDEELSKAVDIRVEYEVSELLDILLPQIYTRTRTFRIKTC